VQETVWERQRGIALGLMLLLMMAVVVMLTGMFAGCCECTRGNNT
jgi:hypothetical protein